MPKKSDNTFYSELLDDPSISNKHYSIKNFLNESYIDFNPQILYVSFWQASNDKDVLCQIMHSHNNVEIMYLAQGKCQVIIEDEIITVNQGDIVIYDKNKNHAEKPLDNNIEVYFLGVDDISFNIANEGDIKRYVRSLGNLSEKMTSIFRELVLEIKEQMSFYQLYLSNLGNLVVLLALRLFYTSDYPKFVSRECKIIVDYLNENYNKEINLESLAQQIYFSKYYLSHMFKSQMGVSPIKYVIMKRIEESKRLLKETNLPVTQIGNTVGYNDPLYFSQIFKKETGYSPSDYRTISTEENDNK